MKPVTNPDLAAAMAQALEQLTDAQPQTPAEVAAGADMTRTYAWRALCALQARGMVERDPADSTRWRARPVEPEPELPRLPIDRRTPLRRAVDAQADMAPWLWRGSRAGLAEAQGAQA